MSGIESIVCKALPKSPAFACKCAIIESVRTCARGSSSERAACAILGSVVSALFLSFIRSESAPIMILIPPVTSHPRLPSSSVSVSMIFRMAVCLAVFPRAPTSLRAPSRSSVSAMADAT